MSGQRVAEDPQRREQLRGIHEALDVLEARLQSLDEPGRGRAVSITLDVRTKIMQALSEPAPQAGPDRDASPE
ncbi:MAG: hypothetical protein KKB50_00215 [Planctomycetes bacterium]|nr:hypothetical protein [Planctomycetota bacterium]